MTPAGAPRVSPALYIEVRDWLLANDPDGPENYDWAQNITPPETAEYLAGDIIWIILCAGRSAQAARTLEKRVFAALRAGQPAVSAFGYRAKAAAIDRAWRERDADFAAFQAVHTTGDVDAMLEWCGAIPFVGAITNCFDQRLSATSFLWKMKGIAQSSASAASVLQLNNLSVRYAHSNPHPPVSERRAAPVAGAALRVRAVGVEQRACGDATALQRNRQGIGIRGHVRSASQAQAGISVAGRRDGAGASAVFAEPVAGVRELLRAAGAVSTIQVEGRHAVRPVPATRPSRCQAHLSAEDRLGKGGRAPAHRRDREDGNGDAGAVRALLRLRADGGRQADASGFGGRTGGRDRRRTDRIRGDEQRAAFREPAASPQGRKEFEAEAAQAVPQIERIEQPQQSAAVGGACARAREERPQGLPAQSVATAGGREPSPGRRGSVREGHGEKPQLGKGDIRCRVGHVHRICKVQGGARGETVRGNEQVLPIEQGLSCLRNDSRRHGSLGSALGLQRMRGGARPGRERLVQYPGRSAPHDQSWHGASTRLWNGGVCRGRGCQSAPGAKALSDAGPVEHGSRRLRAAVVHQLAKNVGFDVCKPDIWLARLAGLPEKTPATRLFSACQSLCAGLAAATGDRIATVDSVLWLACNKQLLEIDAAGVRFVPRAGARRSIFEAAE